MRARGYLNLCKAPISLLSAVSAAAGFLISGSREWSSLCSMLAGITLLAFGTSALNEFQERKSDALMGRTRLRPLPSHAITPSRGLTISLFLIIAGLVTLECFCGWMAASFGLIALILYNGVYTPLKKITHFAILPGALIGAIPPVIGWVSAGAAPWDSKIISLAALIFVWQVPHFWLLFVRFRSEYEAAGFASPSCVMAPGQIARTTVVWISGVVAVSAMLPLFGVLRWPAGMAIVGILGFVLFAAALKLLLYETGERSSRGLFHATNAYMLIVLITIGVSPLLCVR